MATVVDIFISYAHADDEAPQGAPYGWVTMLAGELRKILRRKLGGAGAEIWMDQELAANDNVSEELLARLRESRTLVLVMSPGYQRSHWCQRELANFLVASEATRRRRNVFVVEIEPIERETWSKALQDLALTPVRFWEKQFKDKAPALLGYPVPPLDGSSAYWRNLNELAHWIAERLAADVESRDAGRRIVLVAETTDDLDEQRESVAALLRQHLFEAVPLRAYPRDTEASYLKAFRGDLRDAALFVQLLGPYEGKRLPDGAEPLAALQACEALAAHDQRALGVLQWRDASLDVDQVRSEAHRALLSGPFVQASGFELFRREILKALRIETSPVPVAAAAGANGLSVYVKADQPDDELERAVCESLRSYDVAPVQPAATEGAGSFARGLELQREEIRGCSGVLFVYGRATLSWLTAQVAYAAQAMGLRRDDLWGAVLDAPPDAPSKLRFTNKNLLNLDCRQGFDPAKVGLFVDSLRGQPGRSRV